MVIKMNKQTEILNHTKTEAVTSKEKFLLHIELAQELLINHCEGFAVTDDQKIIFDDLQTAYEIARDEGIFEVQS